MKIALIGKYGEGDIITGPERVARELYSELKTSNNNIVFIDYFFNSYQHSPIIKKLFGRQTFSNDSSLIRLGILPLLFRLIKQQYDVIHIVNSQRLLLFVYAIKIFINSKFIATLHGLHNIEVKTKNSWNYGYLIDSWIEKNVIKKSNQLIFPSSILFKIFNQYYKIDQKRVAIIPNGISKIFVERKNSFPSIRNKIKCVFYNGFDGSIDRGLSELFVLVKLANIKIELFIIGETDSHIQSSENIEVIFVRIKNPLELIEFLCDKHVVVKSNTLDSFSIFTAECMALGLIPIVSYNTGIMEFIKNGVNGFVYDNSSSNHLSQVINDISDGKFDLDVISNNAKKIYETLNWMNITEKYFEAYQKLL